MPRAKPKQQRSVTRPLLNIDWKIVDGLLEAGCSGVQVASHIGVHRDTLYDRTLVEKGVIFSAYAQSKKSTGDSRLAFKQYEDALGVSKVKGNVQLLLRLGETRLGQGKNVEVDQDALRNSVLIEQEIERRVAAALQQRGISQPDISDKQPVSHQGLGGEEGSLRDELGSETIMEGSTLL